MMLKKVFLIGLTSLLLLTGVFGAVSCARDEVAEEPVTKPAVEEIILAPTPTPTPEIETTEPEGITGTVTLAPEAKGKIEIKHRLLWGFKESPYSIAPRIEIEIKNISNELISFDTLRLTDLKLSQCSQYKVYTIKFVSLDKEGQILEESPLPGGVVSQLRPKAITTYDMDLFPSDETRSYEIIVEYWDWPEITGKFVSNPEFSAIEAKLNISHRLEKDKILVEITNIADEPVVPPPDKRSVRLRLIYNFKDGSSEESPLTYYHTIITEEGKPLDPGERKSFSFTISRDEIERIESYELRFG